LRIRFQADANLDPPIGRGLLRREPAIDFQGAAGVIPDGTSDPIVLQGAADAGRVLVTRDLRTMRVHFQDFVARRDSKGVLLVPSTRSIGAAIEGLLIVWLNWTPEDLRNQVRWLSVGFGADVCRGRSNDKLIKRDTIPKPSA